MSYRVLGEIAQMSVLFDNQSIQGRRCELLHKASDCYHWGGYGNERSNQSPGLYMLIVWAILLDVLDYAALPTLLVVATDLITSRDTVTLIWCDELWAHNQKVVVTIRPPLLSMGA